MTLPLLKETSNIDTISVDNLISHPLFSEWILWLLKLSSFNGEDLAQIGLDIISDTMDHIKQMLNVQLPNRSTVNDEDDLDLHSAISQGNFPNSNFSLTYLLTSPESFDSNYPIINNCPRRIKAERTNYSTFYSIA